MRSLPAVLALALSISPALALSIDELQSIVNSHICRADMPLYADPDMKQCEQIKDVLEENRCVDEVRRQQNVVHAYNEFVRRCQSHPSSKSTSNPSNKPPTTGTSDTKSGVSTSGGSNSSGGRTGESSSLQDRLKAAQQRTPDYSAQQRIDTQIEQQREEAQRAAQEQAQKPYDCFEVPEFVQCGQHCFGMSGDNCTFCVNACQSQWCVNVQNPWVEKNRNNCAIRRPQ